MELSKRTGRIGARFAALAEEGRPAFVPYVTVGYPALSATRELVAGLAEVGADIIELGIPFSDPMADGPTIQRASQAALDRGTTVDDVLDVLAGLRAVSDVPVVVFTYLNAVYARGVSRFAVDAATAGADGLLATDLPLGADPDLEDDLERGPLDLVRLVAPTTPPERRRQIADRSQGFVYYVSRTGVTGAAGALPEELRGGIRTLRGASATPVAVGFGVSTPAQARSLGQFADGVVVGSALVECVGTGGVEAALVLARSLREALDASRA